MFVRSPWGERTNKNHVIRGTQGILMAPSTACLHLLAPGGVIGGAGHVGAALIDALQHLFGADGISEPGGQVAGSFSYMY
jgi:hypothetical protein